MSDRNSFDYLNLDNFDESLDSRDYRRRRPERRGGSMSYSGRPSYDRRRSGGRRPNSRRPSSRRRRRRNRRRTRNRIVIVLSFLLVFALLITLIATMINGCGRRSPSVTTSTETKPPQQATVAATAPPARTSKEDMLSISNFIEPQPIDDNTDGEETGAIYVWNRNGFELFGGSEDSGVYYADNVNKLAAKIPTVNVYSMIVPNHTEMGLPARLRGKVNSNSQAANIKNAYAAMSSGMVKPINAYNYLSEHCNEYIYFKSDHHWTGLGAYYAYIAFADTLGLPALSLSDCTEAKIPGFTGTLTDLAPGLDTDTVSYWKFPYTVTMDITDSSGTKQTYDSPYFEQEESGSLSYGVFIYGDNPLTVMRSSSDKAQQGKKIAVIKESYGNAFVPYLTYNYEEVHVMDMRTFRTVSTDNFAAYCEKNGITDVLFFNGIMSANNQDLLDSTAALFN